MGFVLIGVLLVVLRLGGWVQFHKDDFWAWVIVLSPFALAALWWTWADASGRTQRKAMQALDERKAARREQQMEALGQIKPGAKKKR
ncbi:TIGR04438 family Trp-rich protein [Roseateles sp.]|uniref:TIGR04438 family Trp-rich protein n=1 Tax=Roseateles sp. TaxID=1971397 RepID=UPI0025EF7E48|nr:TIGR04438 family Trp-rich protein [Roseateles sp.]MBV8036576.1 TIGR04438 family Trp-rich protein [Roseateles sp.]